MVFQPYPGLLCFQPYPGLFGHIMVESTRHKGRVVHVEVRVVFGQEEAISAALAASPVSTMINTAFVERHHGTDRSRNGRKIRRSLGFSKDWKVHNAVTYFTMYSYNFCWSVRTLRLRGAEGQWERVSSNKLLQKYAQPTSHDAVTLLSAQNLSDSNFPEAAGT